MNGPLPPVISFDKFAAGPAGRAGAVVVDGPTVGFVVVVDPDLLLPPLEHAYARSASTVHATMATDGVALSERCTRLAFHPTTGTRRGT